MRRVLTKDARREIEPRISGRWMFKILNVVYLQTCLRGEDPTSVSHDAHTRLSVKSQMVSEQAFELLAEILIHNCARDTKWH